jgi:Rrf2 family protein
LNNIIKRGGIMTISTKGRYALRLMLDIAEHNSGESISIKDISTRQEISIKYLEQIVSFLCKAGLLKSVRGSRGGYKLVKEPNQYTIGEILRVTEGNLYPVACLEDEQNKCARVSVCKTIDFWKGLYDLVNKYVDGVTLQDLIDKNENNNYYI